MGDIILRELRELSPSTGTSTFTLKKCITPGPYTPMAFASIMTGVPPVLVRTLLPSTKMTLAEIFKANGYDTFGIAGGNPSLSHLFGYGRGFDHFDDLLDNEKLKKIFEKREKKTTFEKYQDRLKNLVREFYFLLTPKRKRIFSKIQGGYFTDIPDAELVNNTFKEMFRLTEKPFFVWLHYLDAHNPYLPKKHFFPKNLGDHEALRLNYKLNNLRKTGINAEETRKLKQLYKAAVHQVASYIKEILLYIKEQGGLSGTRIIITADHGEGFGEHGFFLHPAEYEEEIAAVPFITNFECKYAPAENFNTTFHIGKILEELGLSHTEKYNYYFREEYFKQFPLSRSSMAWFRYDEKGTYGRSSFSPCLSFRKKEGERIGMCFFHEDRQTILRQGLRDRSVFLDKDILLLRLMQWLWMVTCVKEKVEHEITKNK
jgi:hypothetical protein